VADWNKKAQIRFWNQVMNSLETFSRRCTLDTFGNNCKSVVSTPRINNLINEMNYNSNTSRNEHIHCQQYNDDDSLGDIFLRRMISHCDDHIPYLDHLASSSTFGLPPPPPPPPSTISPINSHVNNDYGMKALKPTTSVPTCVIEELNLRVFRHEPQEQQQNRKLAEQLSISPVPFLFHGDKNSHDLVSVVGSITNDVDDNASPTSLTLHVKNASLNGSLSEPTTKPRTTTVTTHQQLVPILPRPSMFSDADSVKTVTSDQTVGSNDNKAKQKRPYRRRQCVTHKRSLKKTIVQTSSEYDTMTLGHEQSRRYVHYKLSSSSSS
jgi:hypothetical protein